MSCCCGRCRTARRYAYRARRLPNDRKRRPYPLRLRKDSPNGSLHTKSLRACLLDRSPCREHGRSWSHASRWDYGSWRIDFRCAHYAHRLQRGSRSKLRAV